MRICEQFKEGELISAEALSSKEGVTASIAIIALLKLKFQGKCEIFLGVYHDCQAKPVELQEFGQGFPDLPWTCPNCHAKVDDYNLLAFDIVARII